MGDGTGARGLTSLPGVRRGPAGSEMACAARSRQGAGRTRAERILVGAAVALGAAVVVVVLGLVADLAAASHADVPETSGVSAGR